MDEGFTLIELLIVIAIIGVLVIVLIVAINPGQKLAETRDTGRNSSINQLGRALQAYQTTDIDGTFPDEVPSATETYTDWMDALVDSNEISSEVALIGNSLTLPLCTHAVINGYCYDGNSSDEPTDVILYSKLEANKNIDGLCGSVQAWSLWSSIDGRTGIVCDANEPLFAGGGQTFVN